MPHYRRATRPSSREDTMVEVPLWVMNNKAGYFQLCGIWWFLRALVIIARLRLFCSVCLDRSGSNCSKAYCEGHWSILRNASSRCSLEHKKCILSKTSLGTSPGGKEGFGILSTVSFRGFKVGARAENSSFALCGSSES